MKRASQSVSVDGMTLVEVVMALGIAAFAIIVVMGLLPTGLNSTQEAKHEQAATDILLEIEKEIRQTPGSIATTPRLQLALPVSTGESTEAYFSSHGLHLAATNSPERVYRARVTRRQSGNPALNTWHVVVEWPALASTAQGSVESVVIRPNSSAL